MIKLPLREGEETSMEAIGAALGCLITYFVVYRLYGRYLGRHIFPP